MTNHNYLKSNKAPLGTRGIRAFIYKVKGIICNPYFAFFIFFTFMFGLFSMVTVQSGDDQFFAAMHLNYSLPGYLTLRYHVWSGRLFCETLVYYFTGSALFFWKWLCAVSITMSALIIYRFITYSKEMRQIEKVFFAYLSCFSVLIISSNILDPSVFWISGALNYLIPFTVCLIAFIPYFHILKDKDYSPNRKVFLYLIPAILVALSGEQLSICFTFFSFLILIFLLVNKRKIPRVLWAIFIEVLIVQIFSFTAPGNTVRLNAEIATWFPTFRQVSIFSRVSLSLYFLFNTIINQWYLLLLLLWLITAILLLKNGTFKISRIIAYISFFFAFLMGLRFISPVDSDISQVLNNNYKTLFEFHYLTKSALLLPARFIPYAFWGIGILMIPFSLLLIFKKSKYSLFYICIYLTALASIAIMIVSPTMYASAGRTSFVSNMLLILLILFLLRHDGLVNDFVYPIMIVALLKLSMYYSSWIIDGYKLTFGVINTQEIPFEVMGIP